MVAVASLMRPPEVIVIGAGPAGLTAGLLLAEAGAAVKVLEADPVYVGGISKTAEYKGYRFDIGGHRFFSKSEAVEELWTRILPHDMLVRPRSSRIYYQGKFYSYPLNAREALLNLGIWRSLACLASYAKARLSPIRNPRTFEDWVTNHFGRRLYRTFFQTYTEKVWGTKCSEISADWAAQRIKGLSLSKAALNALGWGRSAKQGQIKTLIHSFRYPRHGPGMLWEAAAGKMQAAGGQLLRGVRATSCSFDASSQRWTVTTPSCSHAADHVISSAPLSELVRGLSPPPSAEALAAAAALKYRDFLTVALIVREKGRFHDNWLYIHDSAVRVGRIQNFKAWSPEMVPDPTTTCYGLEYFCFAGDGLWTSSDADLIALATRELAALGLAEAGDVLDGCVVRQPKAYPVYDDRYREHVATIREELAERYPGLHAVGRNGMHRYNNQDHSMMTAMLAVKNILTGASFDLWQVNEDAEYHESDAGTGGASGLRGVPRPPA